MATTFSGWNEDLTNHINNKNNPHNVNWLQIGASPQGFAQNAQYYNSGSFMDCVNDLYQRGFIKNGGLDTNSLVTFFCTNDVTGLPDSTYGWYSCLVIGPGNEKMIMASPSWVRNRCYWCNVFIGEENKYVMDDFGWQEFDVKSNRNLLRNSRFNINQRGQSTYTTPGYSIDGWKIGGEIGGPITVTYNYGTIDTVTFNLDHTLFFQNIESIYNFRGQIATVTVLASNVVGDVFLSDDNNLTVDGQHTDVKIKEGYTTWTFEINENINPYMASLGFWGTAGSSFHPIAIKMELGRISTLPIDIMQVYTEKDYEEDLNYCRRYLQVYPNVSLIFYAVNNWYGNCFFDLQRQLRVYPTFMYYGDIVISDDTSNSNNASISGITLSNGHDMKPILKALTTDGKLIAGNNYKLNPLTLVFSAEL